MDKPKTVPFVPRGNAHTGGNDRSADNAYTGHSSGSAILHPEVFDAGQLKEQNTIGKKITEARKAAKFSQKDLASGLENYNISIKPGSISKWEKGDALPNPYQLLAVCHLLGIDDVFNYFIGSTPERADYTPELSQKGLNLLQMFKEALITSGKYTPRSRRTYTEPIPEVMVRVFTTPAAAGSGSILAGEDYDMIGFDPSNVPEGTDFGIRVTGNSMFPRYVPGQIVFVEQCEELYPGEIGVFVCNDNAYIKQYREDMPQADELDEYSCDGRIFPKVTLYSLNRDCADCDVHITPNDRLYVVGRVLN